MFTSQCQKLMLGNLKGLQILTVGSLVENLEDRKIQRNLEKLLILEDWETLGQFGHTGCF